MQFAPDNKIVQLCAKGMNAEFQGEPDKAKALFTEAWEAASNDFEAFVAAHYLARQQPTPEDTLCWNLESLTRANAVTDQDMSAYYPSLYLNMGKSYEDLGDIEQAAHYYHLADDSSHVLPTAQYGQMLRNGIKAGLKRVGEQVG